MLTKFADMTINYLIQSKSEAAEIYVRISKGRGLSLKRKIGLQIDAKKWKKGWPVQKDVSSKKLHADLQKIKTHLFEKANNAELSNIHLDSVWLENSLNSYFGRSKDRSDLVSETIDHIIASANSRPNGKGGIGLSKGRVQHYKNLKKKLEAFRPKSRFRDVDLRYLKDFFNWFIKKQYSIAYASKRVSDLKAACSEAEELGLLKDTSYRRFKSPRPESIAVITLNSSELQKIRDTNMPNNYLNNAKKWLLFGCSVGQRVGDLMKISEKHIIERGGIQVVELTQQKTGKKVTIPILKEAKLIIRNGFPKPISAQKFNLYIKDVCKISGINNETEGSKYNPVTKRKERGVFPKYELIASHVCRRSFATNYYGILPTPLIMQVTGHTTEKMLLQYIGKSGIDYAKQIIDFLARAQ